MENVVIIFDFMLIMTVCIVVTQRQSAGWVGMETNWCGDGREWNRMSAGAGGGGFEVCGDGWGWDQNPIPMQTSIPYSAGTETKAGG